MKAVVNVAKEVRKVEGTGARKKDIKCTTALCCTFGLTGLSNNYYANSRQHTKWLKEGMHGRFNVF